MCGASIATRFKSSRARSPPLKFATVVSCLSKPSPNCASFERREDSLASGRARRMISSGVSVGSSASIWCWWN